MGCASCGHTGIAEEYEPETGFVDIPCPECIGADGAEPVWVTDAHDAVADLHDALTQEDVETKAHLGLAASGHLLLAEGHLRKAEQTLGQTPEESLTAYMAGEAITRAVASTREAQELLKEEEPCKKP